jgi:hypothetical protein
LRRRLPEARPLFRAFFTDPTASVMAPVVRTYHQERHVAESMLRAGRFYETGGATDVHRGENSLSLLRAQPMKNVLAALSEPSVGLIIDLEPI